MAKAKHLATYPLYSVDMWCMFHRLKRVGTGFINRPDDIPKIRAHLAKYGVPLRIRWRNEECRRAAGYEFI